MLREFFIKIFSTTEGSQSIELFNVWHILYLLLIIGGSIAGAILIRNKSQRTKDLTLKILAWLIPSLYIADFLIMPLSRSSFTIDTDKLPFHICTLMAFFAPFAQFNKKFEPIKEAICCLTLVASLMYMTYPGSAIGDILPWCYRVVQTFLYHGAMFAWALLSLATGSISLNFRTIWKALVGIVLIIIWASIGNNVYSYEEHHYDWFFVTGSTFPFIPYPEVLMPIVVFVAVGGMCAIIHLIDLGIKRVVAKIDAKKSQEQQ